MKKSATIKVSCKIRSQIAPYKNGSIRLTRYHFQAEKMRRKISV